MPGDYLDAGCACAAGGTYYLETDVGLLLVLGDYLQLGEDGCQAAGPHLLAGVYPVDVQRAAVAVREAGHEIGGYQRAGAVYAL